MSRSFYDPVLSKTDPLTTVHVKLPKSVLAALNSASVRRQRPYAFIIREQMIEWARRFRAEQVRVDASPEVLIEEEFETERGGRAPKKRKSA